jgi:hypothetical protein
MGKKKSAPVAKMDIDDAPAATEPVALMNEPTTSGGGGGDEEPMDAEGLSGKQRKKAEWLARTALKAKVSSIKKDRCVFNPAA